MKDALKIFKIRLLLEALNRVPKSEWHAFLIQEAQFASVQAEGTQFPELVLPCLFEERIELALKSAQQREKAYWGRLEPLGAGQAVGSPN